MFAQVKGLLGEAFNMLDKREMKKAKSHYNKIKELYGLLPKEYKEKVSDKCKWVFEKLSAG